MATSNQLIELQALLKQHDWFYYMKDRNTVKKGEDRARQIDYLRDATGSDGERLYRAHHDANVNPATQREWKEWPELF